MTLSESYARWADLEARGSSADLPHDGRTVLSVDDVPVARTRPHGRSLWSLDAPAARR